MPEQVMYSIPMKYLPNDEWLETDGAGAFSTGTVSGIRTRRYHALLMNADSPSLNRKVMIAGFDAWLEAPGQRIFLTQQRYADGVITPVQGASLVEFTYRPWPKWTFALHGGGQWCQEFFISSQSGESVLHWEGHGLPKDTSFHIRTFMACRDYHALQKKNKTFCFEPMHNGKAVCWQPYAGSPSAILTANGTYTHEPYWYEQFEYTEEKHRGFDFLEDLASPGCFSWQLTDHGQNPVMTLSAMSGGQTPKINSEPVWDHVDQLRQHETCRRDAISPLDLSASQYLVKRDDGLSIVAGYPWFTDWGRDTFIAMRGLCISLGKLNDAGRILETWMGMVQDGLLPNVCPDNTSTPEYGAVDAPLWFIIAAHDYMKAARKAKQTRHSFNRSLRDASCTILENYMRGTRYRIHATDDGLLAAGISGFALTWMDAKIDGKAVTPRIGKPVELQCLWVNALETVRRCSPEFNDILKKARRSFIKRFWCAKRGYLADVIDVDHVEGTMDTSLRPNQILAVGGLPCALVPKSIGHKIVETVTKELWTPMGLRTLAPQDPGYQPRYEGSPQKRDAAYHQGTVWPWLTGAFGEAWLRIHGDTPDNREHVRRQFLEPLEEQLESYGLGHLAEISGGDAPHTPNGCPFQAWSLGEYLRLKQLCTAQSLF